MNIYPKPETLTAPNAETWMDRLCEEEYELTKRLSKLIVFLSSKKEILDDIDIELLSAQVRAMEQYQAILISRMIRYGLVRRCTTGTMIRLAMHDMEVNSHDA